MSAPGIAPIFDHGTGAFTTEELDRLERHCDGLALAKSSLTGPQGAYTNNAIRICQVASIRQTQEIMWFYERLAAIVRTINNRSYRFDLQGFSEPPQYMVYREAEGSHFDWHMDTGSLPPRKLSLTLQLSDPKDYAGGDLEFSTGTMILPGSREKGSAIAFPSHVIHRVTPITKGTRKAIVAWVTGPDFR